MRPTLLVLGVGGQVGRALSEAAPSRVLGLTHAELDICNETTVEEAIRRFRPNTIINAAAFTAVDRAETESGEAFRVNRDGARVVALAAAAANIRLIHLSTDYVFDGQSRVPYTESDPVRPLSVYGSSKEEGERAVRDVSHEHVILRSAWVYSPYGTNFVRTMLRLGSERSELGIVDDQTGCPTAAADIATAILAIVDAVERQGFNGWGTYQYVGADAVTWYGFAKLIFETAKRFGRQVPRLHPINTAEYPTAAPRPAYSVLSTEKLEHTFGIRPRPLRESLSECLERLLKPTGGTA